MKILALACLCAVLSGCASMLDRSYESVTAYTPVKSETGQTAIRVESYRDLSNAILSAIHQGTEQLELQLHNYTDSVEEELADICQTLLDTDPVAAYSVDYIRHSASRILSYYKIELSITYRRTTQQVAEVVSVSGSGALQAELTEMLATFTTQRAFRINSFTRSDAALLELVETAYYNSPATALGMPACAVSIYPDSGSARIVEFQLTYPADRDTLSTRSTALIDAARVVSRSAADRTDPAHLFAALRERVVFDVDDTGINTAYAALLEGAADGEGLALAYKLLCDMAGVACVVVRGEDGEGTFRCWNILTVGEGSFHIDPTAGEYLPMNDEEAAALGLTWDKAEYPPCVGAPQPAEEETEEP